ncbi:break repair meiotic recombinase recruitment factor 1 isoform X2 [Rana temporaria]|uniref:break repair meiotic recombinase recruitment factor 1 isoform X2 n=1 Tax=Rana temporaria TaxID=8407 RepID=UPI001AAD7527|nr:break repair meiotic recombinase recruitment factor 1 isoform X2 [Rana temporaria]
MRKKKKESRFRCPIKKSTETSNMDADRDPFLQPPGLQETANFQKTTGPQETPSLQKTPDRQETPGLQKTPDHQETPGLQKTPDHQETPGLQKTPDLETLDPQETPGLQKTSDHQETPSLQKTPDLETLDPQETPDLLKTPDLETPDHQETPSLQKTPDLETLDPQETSGLQKTPDHQETPSLQKTPDLETLDPQETPDLLKTPDLETPDHQETSCLQKTPDPQETPGLQKTPDLKTPDPQETPDLQKTPDLETPGLQKTSGLQVTPDPQETPGTLQNPSPQLYPGFLKTPGPQVTPEIQETSGNLKTPSPHKTIDPQETSGLQKTPGPQKAPTPQTTSDPHKTPVSQPTPGPLETPGCLQTPSPQKITDPRETFGLQKTQGNQKTTGPSTQDYENPGENLCSSQLRISQCDDAQPVSWMTPTIGPTQASNLEESPPLPLTAVLIPCHQRDPCQTNAVCSSAEQETFITDAVQSPGIEPATQCAPGVFSIKLLELDTSDITDTSFTDKCPPDLRKQSERSSAESEKSSDRINVKKITSNKVTSNSGKAEDTKETLLNGTKETLLNGTKETLLNGTCSEMAQCTLTNIGINDGKQPQSDIPEFQVAQSEEVSLLKIPVLQWTEQDRSIPDNVSQLQADEGQNSMSVTQVSHLAGEDPQVQELDFHNQKTLMEPSMSPRLAGTETSGMEDVPFHGAEMEPSGGTETAPELPDSELLGALEESLCHVQKSKKYSTANGLDEIHSNGDATIAITPVTSTSSVQQKPTYKAPHTNLLTNGISAVPPGRQQERRWEDASSTVQGLVVELSNLNRLIMSTYRDLRQKRVRHPPGRGAARKRRREM